MIPEHLTRLRSGLKPGLNLLTDAREDAALGLTYGIWKLGAGEHVSVPTAGLETALLVIVGKGTFLAAGERLAFDRKSWLEESPSAVHVPAGTRLEIDAERPCEIALLQTPNTASLPVRLFRPEQVPTEHRGRGKAGETAYRLVRTVFDYSSSPHEAKLVLGEVIALPGKWSSYPPHHHPQPELYYYRFEPEQGYGHAECGENVYLVRQHDATRILGGDHAQVVAPGYHMYYLWAIRHLDGQPYTGFEYTAAHRWVFE